MNETNHVQALVLFRVGILIIHYQVNLWCMVTAYKVKHNMKVVCSQSSLENNTFLVVEDCCLPLMTPMRATMIDGHKLAHKLVNDPADTNVSIQFTRNKME